MITAGLLPALQYLFPAAEHKKSKVSGIPCKHAVACIFNMTDNGIQVGLPEDWVHQSMRLQTWSIVYSFKINPVPGKVGLSLVANVVRRVTTKEVVKDQVLLVVELQVYHKHQGKGKHLQVPLTYKAIPKICKWLPTTKATQRAATQAASASASASQPTRQTQRPSVAAKKTPTRQSQRQKAARMTTTM
ncbi:hypothetical protein Tco_1323848 [Tanacetum coccineum]